MIEKVHIKGQKGILPIVLFFVFPFLNVISFFLAISYVKKSEQLRYSPKCFIIGRFYILSGDFWGYVNLLWFLLMVAVACSDAGAKMALYYWACAFISFVIGCCLINFYKRHNQYLANVDKLLSRVQEQPVITKSELSTMFPGTKKIRYSYTDIHNWLEDLSLNGVISYREEAANDNVFIKITAPELVSSKDNVPKKESRPIEKIAWTCSSCGAKNQSVAPLNKAVCEYCGAPSK